MSLRRKRYTGEAKRTGAASWVVTYGDMVTLLLTFFVLLFAMSNIDKAKFDIFITSFQGRLAMLQGGKTFDDSPMLDQSAQDVAIAKMLAQEKEFEKIYKEIENFIEDNNLNGKVDINLQERGITVHLMEGALFDPGYAVLRPDAKQLLNKLANKLKDIDKDMRIEGHTDNIPINNEKFPSNWELSAARAVSVVRYFIEKHGYSPATMSAVGYGEYRPIVPNNSEKNRAQNRRVDIVILKEVI
jgi:chemotaxis protein MotB